MPITFKQLAKLNPGLNVLLAAAKAWHANTPDKFCATAVWYGYDGHSPGLKARLCLMVGWDSPVPGVLQSPEAYDVAYETIYAALPDCREGCECQGGES